MRKLLSGVIAGALILGLFAGCGNNTTTTAAPGGDTEPGGSGDKKEVNFILWDYKEGSYDHALVQGFQAAHDEYEVKVTTAPNADYETKLTTMISGGSAVDVFLGKSNTVYPQLVDQGFAIDLTDRINGDDGIDLEPFGSMLKNQYELDGKYYGLPYRTNDWVFFYNKKIFDDAGVDYPSNNMTWQQARELAKEVTSGEGVNKIYGLGFQPRPGFILPMLVGAIPDFSIVESDLSGLKEPMEFFNALQFEDKTYQEFAESVSMSQDQTYFFKGTMAMYYNGSWMAQMLSDNEELDFEWGIAKAPYWEGTEQRVFVTSTPVLMSNKAANPDGAWALLKYYVGEEGAKVLASNKLVPSYQTEEVMQAFNEVMKLDESSIAALTGNKTYDFGPANIKSGELSSAFNQELDLFLTNNQDADTTIAGMESRRTEILNK